MVFSVWRGGQGNFMRVDICLRTAPVAALPRPTGELSRFSILSSEPALGVVKTAGSLIKEVVAVVAVVVVMLHEH
jgi:hypothetical protein